MCSQTNKKQMHLLGTIAAFHFTYCWWIISFLNSKSRKHIIFPNSCDQRRSTRRANIDSNCTEMCWCEICESAGVISRNRAFYIFLFFFFGLHGLFKGISFIHSFTYSFNQLFKAPTVAMFLNIQGGGISCQIRYIPALQQVKSGWGIRIFRGLQKRTLFVWLQAPSLLGSKRQCGLWGQTMQGVNATHRCHRLGKLFVCYATHFSHLQWKSS